MHFLNITLHSQSDSAKTTGFTLSPRHRAQYTLCDGFYFGSESPSQQARFISEYRSRPVLIIAEQNTECAIGSAFCLLINEDKVRFLVNLDVLMRSGVRTNPDVLMLARKNAHE
jgi:hypothetical protein